MAKLITFGCRMNVYDSKILERDFQGKDAFIVNTCCITTEAERQCRQKIRKLARENPGKTIYVTGCSSALHPEYYKDFSVLPRADSSKTSLVDFDSRVRAFIPIQTGCNHSCTYCIVPSVRGKAVFFDEAVILGQIRQALNAGVIEVVITGIDLASYPDLAGLIKKIFDMFPLNTPHPDPLPQGAREIGLQRLRLGSFDPAMITDDLVTLFRDESRLMPHLHLSLQHASDLILKRMGRRHLSKDVSENLKKLRAARPDMAFGADIICGFPTETEADFDFLCRFVQDNILTLLHVFPYSERPGTPAALMPPVPVPVRKERAKKLRAISEQMKKSLLETYIGQTVRVLVEEEGFGYTENYLPVMLDTGELKNQIVQAKITGVHKGEMMGVLFQQA